MIHFLNHGFIKHFLYWWIQREAETFPPPFSFLIFTKELISTKNELVFLPDLYKAFHPDKI